MSLKGKKVFITGASAGIGEACAIAFAKEGSDLILSARRLEKINELAEILEEKHKIKTYSFKLDVRSNSEVKRSVDSLPDEWRSIDILVNNAGLSQGLDKVQDGNIDDWERMLDTNVKGLLYVTRAILPGMIKNGKGHIINLSSIAAYQVYSGGNVYCASKFAVRALTEGMQIDTVDTPVRVSAVAPGLVDTEFSVVRFKGDKEKADSVYKGLKPLTGEDVAEAVIFCATRPEYVNINEMIIMPKDQAAVYAIHREM
ncbi:SDR family oxidoreductase [candidate division KSB1 bacterium]